MYHKCQRLSEHYGPLELIPPIQLYFDTVIHPTSLPPPRHEKSSWLFTSLFYPAKWLVSANTTHNLHPRARPQGNHSLVLKVTYRKARLTSRGGEFVHTLPPYPHEQPGQEFSCWEVETHALFVQSTNSTVPAQPTSNTHVPRVLWAQVGTLGKQTLPICVDLSLLKDHLLWFSDPPRKPA